MHSVHTTIFVFTATLATAACERGSSADGAESPPPHAAESTAEDDTEDIPLAPKGRILRLAEHLHRATVESPIVDVTAVNSLLDFAAQMATHNLFAEDFAAFQPAAVGWTAKSPCRVANAPGGSGQSLRYDGNDAHICRFVIAVEPSTHYRISRSILSADPHIDFRVMESRKKLLHPNIANHPKDVERAISGKFVGMRDLLYVHGFPTPKSHGTWEKGSLHLFTSPYSRSLVIMLHDAGALPGTEGVAYFDAIAVDKLQPSREQELALWKSHALAEGADAALGMYKHDQFLPIGNVSLVGPPYDHNYDHRYGLFAPTPSTLSFSVTLPERARLRFSTGLFKGSRAGDEATFSVHIKADSEKAAAEADDSSQQLFTNTLQAHEKSWHWHEHVADLSRYAGKTVQLTLKATAPGQSKGLAVWGNPMIDTPRKPGDPANVIVLAIDTLRADRLSMYGHWRQTSVNLDALAQEGVLFEHGISKSNWTSPAFASMMTGLTPSRHQVIHRARAIAPDITTLAEHFQKAGYSTSALLYKAYLYNMGFEQGFDTWFNVPRYDVRAQHNLAKAMDWLESHHDRQFFLFLHFNDPHQPFNQPPPFERRFNDAAELSRFGVKMPIVIVSSNDVRGCANCGAGKNLKKQFKTLGRDLYDGAVAYTDQEIGKFFQALKDRGIYDDTIIVLVSDHGELMWEHADYFGHGGPYMYDELIRVPLVFKPAKGSGLAQGKKVTSQVNTYDLMPTLLDMVNIPYDAPMQAESLIEHLKPNTSPKERVAISENLKQKILSVRYQGWKYILFHPEGRAASERLYHIAKDPKERRNVANEHKERLRKLRALAMAFMLEHRRGRYVIVTGDGSPRRYSITVTSKIAANNARGYFGLPMTQASGTTFTFEGQSDSPLLLFARFDVGPNAGIAVQVNSPDDATIALQESATPKSFQAYSAGLLRQALGTGEIAAYLLEGAPSAFGASREGADDAQRLSTLKALGYIDED